MKKLTALMLAILLLLCAVSCVETGEGGETSAPESGEGPVGGDSALDLPYVHELSETELYMIETDWKAFKGEDAVWLDVSEPSYEAMRFYGIFGDNCYIIFHHIGWELENDCSVSVADKEFVHGGLFEICAYKDNIFYDLGEAYEAELLSLPEVMILADIHSRFESSIKAAK